MALLSRLRRGVALFICPELAGQVDRLESKVSSDIAPAPSEAGTCHANATGPATKVVEKTAQVPAPNVSAQLILLAETMAAHQGVTHFAISMRALRKGDFFKKLKDHGADCRTQTASRLLRWFSDNWPADLEWPPSVPRPTPSKKEAA